MLRLQRLACLAALCRGAAAPAAERIFPDDPNSPSPIQQNTHDAAHPENGPNSPYELGQVFQVSAPGNVTAVRLFAAQNESGPHAARIWRVSDAKALAETTIPASAFGVEARWVQWPIGPVSLAVGQLYMVTVACGTDAHHDWAGCPSCWPAAGSNGAHISWPAGSARFDHQLGTMPRTTPADGQSYLRDVVFCASLTEECGPLPPPPPPPKPAAIIIAGPRAIARPVGDTMRRSASYLAEVVDQ